MLLVCMFLGQELSIVLIEHMLRSTRDANSHVDDDSEFGPGSGNLDRSGNITPVQENSAMNIETENMDDSNSP